MYAKGVSTRELDTLHDIYGVQTSHETISRMTYVYEWQTRSLEPVYPFVYFDVCVCQGRSQSYEKGCHSVIGIDLKGRKDVLELYSPVLKPSAI